ncbi:multiple resistance and pH regulation protein F, MrpF/PhaF family [Bacteriovorax sp. BAL6_X]|uniref:monovalent cation/H+ antiporter complex subunit F n=1 Tax=Bacteriovorax sp. BAL6_X TaxID=1201290 RepID=UPI000385BDA5|nr:MrpF/PhaF family protein [Bacteriovorax sp. BAL6_X]EPZ49573.1 multiple resistance and pH regulation protein F, MrpF/PhaF family [Bacteriovorax sp. BAL6_X]
MSVLLKISTGIVILTFLLLTVEAKREKEVLVKVLAFDLIGTSGVSLFLILYTSYRDTFFHNIAQLFAIVGFVTAFVFAVFLSNESREIK